MKGIRRVFGAIFNTIRFIVAFVIGVASIGIWLVDVSSFIENETVELGVKFVAMIVGLVIAMVIAPETGETGETDRDDDSLSEGFDAMMGLPSGFGNAFYKRRWDD